jgi:hypothetical protein
MRTNAPIQCQFCGESYRDLIGLKGHLLRFNCRVFEDVEFLKEFGGPTPLHKNAATLYATLMPRLIPVARRHGYALAVHGSMSRDCDLVAIPWTAEAVQPLELAKALRDAAGGHFKHADYDQNWSDEQLTKAASGKLHGRFSLPIHFTEEGGNGAYIDLSIMPPSTSS